jgi:hypothetical protein
MTLRKLALMIAPGALLLAACSSSSSPSASPTSTTPAAVTTTTSAAAAAPAATSSAATSAATASSALSGTWSGQYGGAFSGTFTLTWQQSSSDLSGTIKLSDPASTVSIHGTVAGSAIKFGTVGSTDITYTGSVSGSSMSGSYQVATPNGSAGGTWSAAKS